MSMKNLMMSLRIKNQKVVLSRQPNLAKVLTSSLVMALAVMGCRSKLDVETKSGAPLTSPAVPGELPKLEKPKDPATAEAPKANPKGDESHDSKEDPNAVVTQGGKFHFQIRDTIRIALSKAFIDGAETLDIYNVTGLSADNEANAPLMIKDYPLPQNMLAGDHWPQGQGYQMAPKGDVVNVNIFAQDSQARRTLLPGKNRLKISVDDDINPRFTYINIWIHSFGRFEFSQIAFPGKSQRAAAANGKGGFLESWINMVAPATVKDPTGQTSLTVGLYNMMHSL
jgi:hypothetical protein